MSSLSMLIMLTFNINIFIVGKILKFRLLFIDGIENMTENSFFWVSTVLKWNVFKKIKYKNCISNLYFFFSAKSHRNFYLQISSFALEVGSKIHTSWRSESSLILMDFLHNYYEYLSPKLMWESPDFKMPISNLKFNQLIFKCWS